MAANNLSVFLPGDTRRTTRELPCRTPLIHFWRQIRSLETKKWFIFYTFYNLVWFWNCKSVFVNSLMPSPLRKLPDFNASPVNLHWRQESKVFPAC